MSGEMVKAILEGRKTQTRRIVKPKVGLGESYCVKCLESIGCCQCIFEGKPQKQDRTAERYTRMLTLESCPFGKPGDLLWVREAFGTFEKFGESTAKDVSKLAYKADRAGFVPGCGWKPSIHMPRWASRITLKVTSVRVERLNHISDDDCEREGIEMPFIAERRGELAQGRFRNLWQSVYGKDSWGANPWAWVTEFEVQK